MSNRLVELAKLGQSIWFDNIQRSLIHSGELKRMIDEDDLRGVTSNPTIFEKAITGSNDYLDQLQALIKSGASVLEIYEGLVVEDISRAADVLKPVYDKTSGGDGFISLEVNPKLAYNTADTIAEAGRLFALLGRRNVMIKIPASQEGIPAIEEAIYQGININITMIFSIENYLQVAEAYIRGLERRAAEGKNVDGIASVASFFVSRVDTMVDKELDDLAAKASSEADKASIVELKGRAAIANAKLAYQEYKSIFHGERFAALKAKGAMVQRQLWASTGTKNPKYSDLMYVDNLIGPETVNTVPPATLAAFKDHGTPALTLESDLEESKEIVSKLGKVGIDLSRVTTQLQIDGLAAFVKSFDTLEESLAAKRASIISNIDNRLTCALGSLHGEFDTTIADANKAKVAQRIWNKDASLWKSDAAAQKLISNALGWLDVVGLMTANADELVAFAEEIRDSGEFDYVMVCGMGGSSLCPEVLRQTFGPQQGFPELLVLDSTDPDQIAGFRSKIEPRKCLFIISSKSGTTTEPNTFYEYWYAEVEKVSANAGRNFIAITDPGTPMESLAASKSFRKTFLNPADIGGRYSALSYFGLVPAALMGLDVKKLLSRAQRIMDACNESAAPLDNPGTRLGSIIGAAGATGRDKLTLICGDEVSSLGLWIEQLIAESTGKEGKGIVPVANEPLGSAESYGSDRLFVSISVGDATTMTERMKDIVAAGHPVIYRTLDDIYDLGEEFFLWEFATAVAGWKLGINPFDQPNVQEAKDATKAILKNYSETGELEKQSALVVEGPLSFFAATAPQRVASASKFLEDFIAQAKPGDYFALQNFLEEASEYDVPIEKMRLSIRDATHCAVTAGYGPRYLHSTGQLHKGGAPNGLFIQITSADGNNVQVPNEPYTFGTLKDAQALGDFQSLAGKNRRAIRIDLGDDSADGLDLLVSMIEDVCRVIGKETGRSAVSSAD